MLFAVIGGAHGNAAALDAALSRVDDLGIHTVLCTGNLAVGADDGNAVIERIRERRVVCVQGELDRMVVRALRKADSLKKRLPQDVFDALQNAHDALTSGNVEFLRTLPRRINLTLDGKTVCLCHGAVASQSTSLSSNDSNERFRRQREDANTDIVICGSDQESFVRTVDETLFVNPGMLVIRDHAVSFTTVNTDADPVTAEIITWPH